MTVIINLITIHNGEVCWLNENCLQHQTEQLERCKAVILVELHFTPRPGLIDTSPVTKISHRINCTVRTVSAGLFVYK